MTCTCHISEHLGPVTLIWQPCVIVTHAILTVTDLDDRDEGRPTAAPGMILGRDPKGSNTDQDYHTLVITERIEDSL